LLLRANIEIVWKPNGTVNHRNVSVDSRIQRINRDLATVTDISKSSDKTDIVIRRIVPYLELTMPLHRRGM
jgi:hypothetical protein